MTGQLARHRRTAWVGLSALLFSTFAVASAARLRARPPAAAFLAKDDAAGPVSSASHPQCTYALSTTDVSAQADGGRFGVNVVTRPGCDWTATTDARWITLAVVRGAGRGAVLMDIQPNTTTSGRSGTLQIAGLFVTVRQDGVPPCSFSVSPTYVSVPAEGGSREVSVTVRTGCAWTVTANETWLVPSVKSGTGSATFSFTAEANGEVMRRTGQLTVGSGTIWVSQSGRPR